MADADLRALLDPLAAVAGARPRYRDIAASTVTPDPTPEVPSPSPIVVPARTEAYTAPADLPPSVAVATVDLGAQVALVAAALAQLWADAQVRTVAGRVTLTSGAYTAGQSFDRTITWDEAPLRTPTGGVVSISSGFTWSGKCTAKIKPGTLSDTGATITIKALAAFTPDGSQPVTFEVAGLYFYVPPFS